MSVVRRTSESVNYLLARREEEARKRHTQHRAKHRANKERVFVYGSRHSEVRRTIVVIYQFLGRGDKNGKRQNSLLSSFI